MSCGNGAVPERRKMYSEDIKALNKWFKKKEKDSYGTYHHTERKDGEDIYVVNSLDFEDFTDYLRENVVDLIGIPCMVGNDGIWFTSKDLDKSRFY